MQIADVVARHEHNVAAVAAVAAIRWSILHARVTEARSYATASIAACDEDARAVDEATRLGADGGSGGEEARS